jgi:hypothetical protein
MGVVIACSNGIDTIILIVNIRIVEFITVLQTSRMSEMRHQIKQPTVTVEKQTFLFQISNTSPHQQTN